MIFRSAFFLMTFLGFHSCTIYYNFPEYWKDKNPTSFNGTMTALVPLTVTSSDYEVNPRCECKINLCPTCVGRKTFKVCPIPRDGAIRCLLGPAHFQMPDDELPQEFLGLPPVGSAHPSNSYPESGGTLRKATYVQGFITNVEVVEPYNPATGNVSVLLCATWKSVDQNRSIQHTHSLFEEAIRNNTVINMTLHIPWRAISTFQSEAMNKYRKVEVEDYFCFYQNSQAVLIGGTCYVPYKIFIEHQLKKWIETPRTPALTNVWRNRITNNMALAQNTSWVYKPMDEVFADGGDPDNIMYMLDFLPTAIGYAMNLTFGRNGTLESYDINFTAVFDAWTNDFPKGLLYNFRDMSFTYKDMYFEAYYWTKDIPPKPVSGIPPDFWIGVIAMGPLVFVVSVVLVMLILTRSKETFNMAIWDLWKEKRTMSKFTKQKMAAPESGLVIPSKE